MLPGVACGRGPRCGNERRRAGVERGGGTEIYAHHAICRRGRAGRVTLQIRRAAIMNAARMMMAEGRAGIAPACAPINRYPFYALRIWYGMIASAWLSLLFRNRFAVSPTRMPFALTAVVTSLVNSSLSLIQNLIFARRIQACVLKQPPIFIIGHWRTGTTHLHELLTVDGRFTAPTTLECFAPAQCL